MGNRGGIVGPSPPGPYTVALDFDVNNNPIYYGRAVQGTAKTDPGWQIRRLTFDGFNNPTDIRFANGSTAFDQIWTARAGLSYS